MVNVPEEFYMMVQNDIKQIETAEQINPAEQTATELLSLHRQLDGRYQACIADWNQGLVMNWDNGKKNIYTSHCKASVVMGNLHMMKAKLETYSMGMNVIRFPQQPATNITVNNNLHITISFEDARTQIENMTSLTNEQTQEILNKISEIEEVVNSTDKKKTKWEKIKPVLIWLADKSFDVGKIILPLLLKVES